MALGTLSLTQTQTPSHAKFGSNSKYLVEKQRVSRRSRLTVSAKQGDEEGKKSLFTSVTDALDFAQVRSAEDAQLLEDARDATRSGGRMSREQYGALRRKIGGTYKDFFKSYVEGKSTKHFILSFHSFQTLNGGSNYDFEQWMGHTLKMVGLTNHARYARRIRGARQGKWIILEDMFMWPVWINPNQVPILTPTSIRWIRPNMLVRFRGMIQDMLGNEFYVGAYKDGSVWRTNKFIDVSQFSMNDSADMRIWERRLLYCVPVPGQNAWTEISSEAVANDCMDWASQQREKRRRTDNESADCVDMTVSGDELPNSPNTKNMRDDQHPSPASEFGAAVTEGTSSSLSVVCGPDANSLPCLVKMYDSPESDLKLNDVFEFVGVLTSDQEHHVDKDCEFSNGFCEGPSLQFLHNKVPLLHCFVYRKLAAQDFLKNNPMAEPKPQLIREIREALLRHLTAILGNDEIAAHFLLLHLLSRVHTRVDAVAVGKLSLNLTSFKNETMSIYGNRLSFAVKDLLPFTHCIPLTVDYLNSTSLAPEKDYDTNRLTTGVLQLAEGSHVIVDETKLEAGILNFVGVENTRLLKNLMQLQKVEYDFKYYKMEMAADVQLLILSEGKSNILPADVVVPFRPSSVTSFEAVTAEALEAWRWYLATARLLPYIIKSEIQKVVENDLVAAMQADRSSSPDDFSRWLTMGRLISLSFGETCLSLEHWEMVKELEKLRRERLK